MSVVHADGNEVVIPVFYVICMTLKQGIRGLNKRFAICKLWCLLKKLQCNKQQICWNHDAIVVFIFQTNNNKKNEVKNESSLLKQSTVWTIKALVS